MNNSLPDDPALQQLIADIETTVPMPHHSALLEQVSKRIPDSLFRLALTRGGWFRSGGLIRPDGARVADNLETWVAQELARCDDDLNEFLDRHVDCGLLATRHTGRTHYFVAPYGKAPAEFLQLEIEELQEVLDRHLCTPDSPPTDTQELTDPLKPALVPAQTVGRPYYRFRRLIDMRHVVARLHAPIGSQHPLSRFMQEWANSRANADFSDHWIVALREQHDRYNNVVMSATPVSRHARQLKTFHWNSALHGLDAAEQLKAFDRAAGYTDAWYFHLVAGGLTPRDMALALMQDIDAGYGYLGDGETALIIGWLQHPYTL